MFEGRLRLPAIFIAACMVGVMAGLFGVGGGVLLVPLLVLIFNFDQHRAQGTSLVALVPPTGVLAFAEYYRAGQVNLLDGFLIMPGIFLGALAGSQLAQNFSGARMRRVFATFLFLIGLWQVIAAWK
ncbi:MAG TPA: sulfite exporter TauE/SafE family protein [Candidatus Dormibacteraeota bacterium]|nr:sulfite exporter TauE/SafE family protein [Candidatus Dormibacteraeota bacterium]